MAEQTITAFERRLLPIARKWHGAIPVWAAGERGVDPSQLRRWALGNENVTHPARGVYLWLTDDPHVDYRHTDEAIALAQGGPDAAFWGPTVMQMAGLGAWGAPIVHIAVRGRRTPRDGILWHRNTGFTRRTLHGLPAEDTVMAIRHGLPYLDDDKREEVLADAVERGIIDEREAKRLAVGR